MKNIVSVLAVAACLFASGCGGEKIPKLAEVTGTLIADGEPVAQVDVFFLPDPEVEDFQSQSQPSRGRTNDKGEFTLQYDGKADMMGAAIGTHRVRLVDVMSEEARTDPMPYRFSQDLVNAGKTPLRVEVKAEGNKDVQIDITDFMN
jgi:hypothetical protein